MERHGFRFRTWIQAGAVLAGLITVAPVEASVIYTSRFSVVQVARPVCNAQGNCTVEEDRQESTDFAPFDGVANFGSDRPQTTQYSVLDANGIAVSLSATGSAATLTVGNADLIVDFVLDKPTSVTLIGQNSYSAQ